MGKSSQYKGVTLFRPTNKWRAQISVLGKTTSLGDHSSEVDAARTFDMAMIHRQGGPGAAKLNFPVADYEPVLPLLSEKLSWNEAVAVLRARAKRVNLSRRGSSAHSNASLEGSCAETPTVSGTPASVSTAAADHVQPDLSDVDSADVVEPALLSGDDLDTLRDGKGRLMVDVVASSLFSKSTTRSPLGTANKKIAGKRRSRRAPCRALAMDPLAVLEAFAACSTATPRASGPFAPLVCPVAFHRQMA
ncbi:unnamed protein product [Pedinophyceae sp. YPF-701]|nr:unnamed protein product [Pedinophyceae sp. YPF-701]